MSAIVALDPGCTTGIAWVSHRCAVDTLSVPLSSEGDTGDVLERRVPPAAYELNDLWVYEYGAAAGVVDTIHAVEAIHGLECVVYESFQLRIFNMTTQLLAPVRMTAYIQAIAMERGHEWKWVPQHSQAMNVISKDRMKRWNLWVRGQGKDARAAVRHLAAFLRTD